MQKSMHLLPKSTYLAHEHFRNDPRCCCHIVEARAPKLVIGNLVESALAVDKAVVGKADHEVHGKEHDHRDEKHSSWRGFQQHTIQSTWYSIDSITHPHGSNILIEVLLILKYTRALHFK